MDDATRNQPEGPARRAARVAQVGARYGFGYVFGRGVFSGRRGREAPERVAERIRLALEDLGPTFVELGHFLSARGDLLSPDVTAELARARVPIPPTPFAEMSALLEGELGNSLERLFSGFEESPARVGVFTQSHRVTLPGDRPALVVANRPGIRRDLLAMRTVADAVRRRMGKGDETELPLDPVATVGEFGRHVAHRRDMFFAAQTVRRLRDLLGEGPDLHIPALYRRYSTSRCATFEMPEEDVAPADSEALRAASGTLTRLAVLEGVYLADVTPRRFVVSGGEVWLADPTEAFALDPERLRGVAEVLAAIRRGDVEGMARVLPLLGGQVPRDTRVLGRELRDVLGSLGGPLWQEHALREMRASGLEALRRGGAVLPAEISQLLASLVAIEELSGAPAEGVADERESTVKAAAAGEALVSRYRDPRYVAERTMRKIAQPEAYAEYPRQIHSLLEELRDGEVEVTFRHRGIDDLISRVDIFANRLVFALLIAALIVGSSLLGIFGETGFRLLGVSVLGLVGFVVAAILGVLLLLGIIRSGRL